MDSYLGTSAASRGCALVFWGAIAALFGGSTGAVIVAALMLR